MFMKKAKLNYWNRGLVYKLHNNKKMKPIISLKIYIILNKLELQLIKVEFGNL